MDSSSEEGEIEPPQMVVSTGKGVGADATTPIVPIEDSGKLLGDSLAPSGSRWGDAAEEDVKADAHISVVEVPQAAVGKPKTWLELLQGIEMQIRGYD